MICAGIDAGSRTIKALLWDSERQAILASGSLDQGVAQDTLAGTLLDQLLLNSGLAQHQVSRIIATGYGRNRLTCAATTVTEITCHAHGVRHLAPNARTIIEIGGQDSKLIRLSPNGLVRDFNMNDRCAAGTGRFLEVMAQRLAVPLPGLCVLARQSRQPAAISNTCVVFAETEIIGLLASGVPIQDIVAGVESALASRVVAMAGRSLEEPVFFTGGVALIPSMAEALQTALALPVQVVPTPLMTGALGAAILAARG